MSALIPLSAKRNIDVNLILIMAVTTACSSLIPMAILSDPWIVPSITMIVMLVFGMMGAALGYTSVQDFRKWRTMRNLQKVLNIPYYSKFPLYGRPTYWEKHSDNSRANIVMSPAMASANSTVYRLDQGTLTVVPPSIEKLWDSSVKAIEDMYCLK